MKASRPSAIVVGSGPNGLAAAIVLAQAGLSVTIFEAAETIGGGMRSAELTLPGFMHDVCSAIHPMGVASPFLRSLPLAQRGVEWIHSPAPLAHPLDDGTAVTLERSLDATSLSLGLDAEAYHDMFAPIIAKRDALLDAILAPLIPPRRPFVLAGFGLQALRSAKGMAHARLRSTAGRALFAGLAAHAVYPLEKAGTAAFALVMGLTGHAWGWPIARGGTQSIATALASHFESLGGTIVTNHRVVSAAELTRADVVMFDVMPRQLADIGGDRLPSGYRNRLRRFRLAPGTFKLDWALSEPIPWRANECKRAATVHIGGTFAEIAASERAISEGRHNAKPFVLLAQQSLFDPSRAPAGRQTAWAYAHVPNGSTVDMTQQIEAQIERFAPGFRDVVLARHVTTPQALERYNANYIGGDVVGGSNDLLQTIWRPMFKLDPYAIPVRGWFLCSAATPPGAGVHGMGGYNAARSALQSLGING